MKSENLYRHKFVVRCPNDNAQILYELEITTEDGRVIMVEDIIAWANGLPGALHHEVIADSAYQTFGGRQTMWATHKGVEIRTDRYPEEPDAA